MRSTPLQGLPPPSSGRFPVQNPGTLIPWDAEFRDFPCRGRQHHRLQLGRQRRGHRGGDGDTGAASLLSATSRNSRPELGAGPAPFPEIRLGFPLLLLRRPIPNLVLDRAFRSGPKSRRDPLGAGIRPRLRLTVFPGMPFSS